MCCVPLDDGRPGTPKIWVENVVLDDLAFAADGIFYGMAHTLDSVVRIEADGTVTTIAAADNGVTGSTVAAFGRTEADRNQLYIVSDGEVFQPPATAW